MTYDNVEGGGVNSPFPPSPFSTTNNRESPHMERERHTTLHTTTSTITRRCDKCTIKFRTHQYTRALITTNNRSAVRPAHSSQKVSSQVAGRSPHGGRAIHTHHTTQITNKGGGGGGCSGTCTHTHTQTHAHSSSTGGGLVDKRGGSTLKD